MLASSQYTKLTYLYAALNNMIGTLPPELSILKYLKELSVQYNEGLTGEIPAEYGRLKNLRICKLRHHLHFVCQAKRLTLLLNIFMQVQMSYTKLYGKFPREFASLTNMEQLLFEVQMFLVCTMHIISSV